MRTLPLLASVAAPTPQSSSHKCQCGRCDLITHASDCAVHNGPAMEVRPCDCSADHNRRFLGLAILASVAALALAGCTTYQGAQPNECQAHQGGIPLLLTVRGCSVQLTAEWAVSAKHQPLRALLPDGIADKDLDLYFYRQKGAAPVWRAPKAGETVTAFGNPWNILDASGATFALPMRVSTTGSVKAITTIAPHVGDAPTPAMFFSSGAIEGYSGGPVVGADGAVIGVTYGMVESKPQIDTTGAGLDAGDQIAVPADAVLAAFQRDVGE